MWILALKVAWIWRGFIGAGKKRPEKNGTISGQNSWQNSWQNVWQNSCQFPVKFGGPDSRRKIKNPRRAPTLLLRSALRLKDPRKTPSVRRERIGWTKLFGQKKIVKELLRGAANFPAAVFLAGKCPNLGRDSISRCRKIGGSFSSSVEICRKTFPALRVRPPGIEWKTGRNPKMGKKLAKKKKMALSPKWGKNGPKMAKKWDLGSFFYFFAPFLGHFFPISGRRPFSIFWPIFSHFWISARFPFYTRRPDSQFQQRSSESHSLECLISAPHLCDCDCSGYEPGHPELPVATSLHCCEAAYPLEAPKPRKTQSRRKIGQK